MQTRNTVLSSVLTLCLIAPFAMAQDETNQPVYASKPNGAIGQRNPRAPAEVSQFDFVAGDWDALVTLHPKDGEPFTREARWHNHWINYGYDLVQEFKSTHAAGSEFRHYNSELGYWEGKNLYAGHKWINTTARMEGDDMVVIVEASNEMDGEFLNRETYYDITQNQWKMKSERSFDHGKTWVQGYYKMVATRSSSES